MSDSERPKAEQEILKALRKELIETLMECRGLCDVSTIMGEALEEIGKSGGRAGVIADAAIIRVREVLK